MVSVRMFAQLFVQFGIAELIIPKSGGYFGEPFHAWRGVRQGDIISPVIFNIVVDAIVREWYAYEFGTVIEDTLQTTFYADDGRLSGTDPVRLSTRSHDCGGSVQTHGITSQYK